MRDIRSSREAQRSLLGCGFCMEALTGASVLFAHLSVPSSVHRPRSTHCVSSDVVRTQAGGTETTGGGCEVVTRHVNDCRGAGRARIPVFSLTRRADVRPLPTTKCWRSSADRPRRARSRPPRLWSERCGHASAPKRNRRWRTSSTESSAARRPAGRVPEPMWAIASERRVARRRNRTLTAPQRGPRRPRGGFMSLCMEVTRPR